MLRSYVHFQARPGMAEAFRQAFHDAGMLTRPRSIAGMIRVELFQSDSDPESFAVLGEWESREAYAAWRAVAQSGADPQAIARLSAAVLEMSAGELLEQVDY